MPTISRFYGIRIRMFFDDKHGPHFHADYSGETAQISILNGKVLSGRLPPRAFRFVNAWAKLHAAESLNNWEKARHADKLDKIAPLK